MSSTKDETKDEDVEKWFKENVFGKDGKANFAKTKYDDDLTKIFDTCKEALKGSTKEGWELAATQDEVSLYLKTEKHTPTKTTKAVGVVKAPAEIVAFAFNDFEMRKKWDDQFEVGKEIEKFDLYTGVSHLSFKAPSSLISARDFTLIGRQHSLGDGKLLVQAHSIEHEKAPAQKSFVRGTIYYSVVYCEPVKENPNWTKVFNIVSSNPNGSIPTFMVNAAAEKTGLVISEIRKLLADKKNVDIINAQLKKIKGDYYTKNKK
jgi:hypothetical protein